MSHNGFDKKDLLSRFPQRFLNRETSSGSFSWFRETILIFKAVHAFHYAPTMYLLVLLVSLSCLQKCISLLNANCGAFNIPEHGLYLSGVWLSYLWAMLSR